HADDYRRCAGGDGARAHRRGLPLVRAGWNLLPVRLRLLSAARLDPGARDRAVADRARGGRGAAFLLFLPRPGLRAGGLWLWLGAFRAAAVPYHRRRHGPAGWLRLRKAVTPPRAIPLRGL